MGVSHVHCRIGSSEKKSSVLGRNNLVHCRIGSSEIKVPVKGISGIVHCRIGSSESYRNGTPWHVIVHCRIGSSEKECRVKLGAWEVHCRIGSSEMKQDDIPVHRGVHCRIGSSEMTEDLRIVVFSVRQDPLLHLPHNEERPESSGGSHRNISRNTLHSLPGSPPRNTPSCRRKPLPSFSEVSFSPTGPLCIFQDRTTGGLPLNKYKKSRISPVNVVIPSRLG